MLLAEERSLLARLDTLLSEEGEALAARSVERILALADERNTTVARIADVSRRRKAALSHDEQCRSSSAGALAQLASRYQELRDRHKTQAKLVQRFAEPATRAIDVLRQSSSTTEAYGADGRAARQSGRGS